MISGLMSDSLLTFVGIKLSGIFWGIYTPQIYTSFQFRGVYPFDRDLSGSELMRDNPDVRIDLRERIRMDHFPESFC